MSTWLYLRCESHDPPLENDGESGQHLYDLEQIWADINTVSYTHLTLPTILRSCRSRWSPYH